MKGAGLKKTLLIISLLFFMMSGLIIGSLGFYIFTLNQKYESRKEFITRLENRLDDLNQEVDRNIEFLSDDFGEVGDDFYQLVYKNGIDGTKLVLELEGEREEFISLLNLNNADNTVLIRESANEYLEDIDSLIEFQAGNAEISFIFVPLEREIVNANKNYELLIDKITLNPDEFASQIQTDITRLQEVLQEAKNYKVQNNYFEEMYSMRIRNLEVELEFLITLQSSATARDSSLYEKAYETYEKNSDEAYKEYSNLRYDFLEETEKLFDSIENKKINLSNLLNQTQQEEFTSTLFPQLLKN